MEWKKTCGKYVIIMMAVVTVLLLAGGAGAALSPTVAPFDTDGNGIIDRAEAVNAEVQFDTGVIPKSTAIEVILTYFSYPPSGTGSANGTVSRSFSTLTPPLLGTVVVTITPDPALAWGLGYQVTETLPAGVAFVSSTADNTNTSGLPNVVFTILGGTPFTYIVTMPNVAGAMIFTGTFRDGFGTGGGVVTGASTWVLPWDESIGSSLPYTWDYTNFEGFNVRGIATERLTVFQPDLSHSQRTIDMDKLTYSTTAHPKRLLVVDNVFSGNLTAAAAAGLQGSGPGQMFYNGYFDVVNWQANRYVALNGKIDKLTPLILEGDFSLAGQKDIILLGETWNIGDGWTLTLDAINVTAPPRRATLVLKKDGINKDVRIVSDGTVYTFVEPSIAGEVDVPMFVTFVNAIFSGSIEHFIQLRYTWVISTNVTTIRAGDSFGPMDVVDVNTVSKQLSLNNTRSALNLTQGSTVDLMGNIKFKVVDDAIALKFYPDIGLPSANGFITGTVTNASSTLPIANATVTAGGITAITNAAGAYNMSIVPNKYIVNASAAGFLTQSATNVSVASEATVTQNFALQPVVSALPLVVAPFDISGDGRIQRNEAVACVVRFFSGDVIVPRSTAVAVVVAFFSAPGG